MTKSNTDAIVDEQAHRPWPLPPGHWLYYQEWNEALFMHWKAPAELIKSLLPTGLQLDMHEGDAWVSLVAFTMEHIRPRFLPALALISNFHEINLRTYVVKDGKAGVYFLSIEASKRLSAYISRKLSALPYKWAAMQRSRQHYRSQNAKEGFYLNVDFNKGAELKEKTSLDTWLTERYCLYVKAAGILYRYDIQHKPWELAQAEVTIRRVHYPIGGLKLTLTPEAVHYAAGVQVLAWGQTIA